MHADGHVRPATFHRRLDAVFGTGTSATLGFRKVLADQLLLPMALAGGGSFHGVHPTSHAETNARVIQAFLPVSITFEQDGDGWRYVVERHAS